MIHYARAVRATAERAKAEASSSAACAAEDTAAPSASTAAAAASSSSACAAAETVKPFAPMQGGFVPRDRRNLDQRVEEFLDKDDPEDELEYPRNSWFLGCALPRCMGPGRRVQASRQARNARAQWRIAKGGWCHQRTRLLPVHRRRSGSHRRLGRTETSDAIRKRKPGSRPLGTSGSVRKRRRSASCGRKSGRVIIATP